MANFIQRAVALAVGLVLAILALIFASLIIALAAAVAIVIGGWLWWRTRGLRREVERRAAEAPPGRVTIEGEYRRLDER
jgi:hypothetical protein